MGFWTDYKCDVDHFFVWKITLFYPNLSPKLQYPPKFKSAWLTPKCETLATTYPIVWFRVNFDGKVSTCITPVCPLK